MEIFISTGIAVAINALILAWVLGKLFATVDANSKWLQAVSDRVKEQEGKTQHLHVALVSVAATCAAYFANNPSPAASEAMREVLTKLENMESG